MAIGESVAKFALLSFAEQKAVIYENWHLSLLYLNNLISTLTSHFTT